MASELHAKIKDEGFITKANNAVQILGVRSLVMLQKHMLILFDFRTSY
jgi:hypothetical protein